MIGWSAIALSLTCVLTQTQPSHDGRHRRVFEGQWKKREPEPRSIVDDAVFLRRVSLELIGMVPSPDDVLRSSSPREDKPRAENRRRSPALKRGVFRPPLCPVVMGHDNPLPT